MKIRKWIVGTTIAATLVSSTLGFSFGASGIHIVKSGDTLWKISQTYQTSLENIYQLNPQHRNANYIEVGQVIKVPVKNQTYTVVANDTPWLISNRLGVDLNQLLALNNLKSGQLIYVGQALQIPLGNQNPITTPVTGNRKTFTTHTVVRGDDLWKISIQYGIPFTELLSVNGLKENHIIKIGDKLTIPVYQIGVKSTPGAQFGELLDWWTEAQYVIPIGKVFTIVDFQTGKRWNAKRTVGANHADVEPLTANDAAIMKQVWGGTYSWVTRPVIVEVDNRRIAASASSLPHDIQYITNNNFNGHFDLYFSNSTRHVDGKPDLKHQSNVLKAAGKN